MKKVAVIGDIQFPHHDARALNCALTLCEEVGIDEMVWAGDIADCTPISSFIKAPADRRSLQREIDLMGDLFYRTRHRITDKQVFLKGNHEERWEKLLWMTPGLTGMKALEFDTVFPVKEFCHTSKGYGEHYDIGKLMVTHGENYGVNALRQNFQRYGQSVITGHTHRLGMYYQTTRRGPHVSAENGCLCDLNPRWTHDPNWQHGFSIVLLDKTGHFQIQQVPIIKRHIAYWGDKKVEV